MRLAAVDPRLEIRLVDGRVLRLAGLDPAQATPGEPDRDEAARAAFAQLLPRDLLVRPLTAQPDRWGRIVAQAFGGAGDRPGGLAALAIAAGLGRYLAEPAASSCRAALVAAEGTARAAKLGLWADPYYAVLAVDDRAAFSEHAGTLVVVEGRVTKLDSSPYRTKLLFRGPSTGSWSGQTFSATVVPRAMKVFEARGIHVSSLVGRSLRLRGLLDLRFGPQIELAGPDDLDVLDPATPQAGEPTK